MAAKMPVAYIENPPVPVSHLRIGEAGHIGFSDVFIDQKDLSTYIRPAAKLQEKTFNTVGVRRDEDGYRLVLHQASAHFTVGNLESLTTDLIPVIEILEQLEPDHIEEMRKKSQQTGEMLDQMVAKLPMPRNPGAISEPEQVGAVMPGSRIRLRKEFLGDLKLDQAAYVDFTAVLVDEKNGSTYIQNDALLHERGSQLVMTVTRRSDGYHLAIQGDMLRFFPGKIADYSRVFPIVEITDQNMS